VAVPENGRQALGHRSHVGQLADQPLRHPELLQILVQPGRVLVVVVAVTEEGHVALMRGRPARLEQGATRGTRHSGKLGHRHPQLDSPLMPISMMD
jgi:hypothetical protein